VESEPAGATCRLERGGAALATINPTPGTAVVPRAADPIQMICSLAQHEETREIVTSSFSGATLGNILLGGIVGLAVDAASGANNRYPDKVIVVLTPMSLPNTAARDAHFGRIRERLDADAAAQVKKINDNCQTNARELCQIDAKKVTDARDEAVKNLDQKRLAAKVGPS